MQNTWSAQGQGKKHRHTGWRQDDNRSDLRMRTEQTNQQRLREQHRLEDKLNSQGDEGQLERHWEQSNTD